MKTIIHTYGIRVDKECLPDVFKQFNLARGLYNNIVAHIGAQREQANQYLMDNTPDLQLIVERLKELNEQFKAAKSINDEDALIAIRAKEAALKKESSPLWKDARKQHKDAIALFFASIGRTKDCFTYQLRCDAVADGLGSTTADDTLDTALKAWDKVRKDGGKLSFRNVRERKQDHINIRFTCAGGIPIYVLLNNEHGMLNIKAPSHAGNRCYGEFSFRLGSAKAGKYANGTWEYHREFPKDANVTTVRLVRKRIGEEYRYYLQFMLSVEEYPVIAINQMRKEFATLHLGFHTTEDGKVRLAGLSDTGHAGCAKFIDMPDCIHEKLELVEKMQSMRDIRRDEIHEFMKMTLCPVISDEITNEWSAIAKLPAQHVSSDRIVALSRKIEREIGESNPLLSWTKRDRRELQSIRGLHEKTLLQRKDIYRQIALGLVKQYEIISVSRYDLKNMALRIKDNGERNELGQKERFKRHSVALYSFIECLKWAAARAGTVIIEHTDMKYARVCSDCGAHFERDSNWFSCESCGAEYDIKANASAALFNELVGNAKNQADEIVGKIKQKEMDASEKKQKKLSLMQAKRNKLAV